MRATAIALLEYRSIAAGMAAVDRMLKCSPIAILKCGTIHPGRYLALVGGSVASTEEAWRTGCGVGEVTDDICLPDPHPALVAGLFETPRLVTDDEAMAVIETTTSPALLRGVDVALKAVPISLTVLRLADDLGGRGLAVFTGGLTDLQAALAVLNASVGPRGTLCGQSLMPRVESTLQTIVGTTTRFAACGIHEPDGAELVPENTEV